MWYCGGWLAPRNAKMNASGRLRMRREWPDAWGSARTGGVELPAPPVCLGVDCPAISRQIFHSDLSGCKSKKRPRARAHGRLWFIRSMRYATGLLGVKGRQQHARDMIRDSVTLGMIAAKEPRVNAFAG